MNVWAFGGGFAAVALAIVILVLVLRRKFRRWAMEMFGTVHILQALSEAGRQQAAAPRSVSGADSLILPRIRKDFPDFDATMAKTYARDYLRRQLRDRQNLTIHKVVFSRYLPSAAQKTIVMQASVGYRQNGEPVQTRYSLHYTYLIDTCDETVAANCPNCGGTLGYGDTVCPYCGSRVVNVMGNTWNFTELREC